MRYFAFVGILLIVAGFALAADIDGTWKGSIDGMDGNKMEIAYTFKADGTTLTGATKGMDGKDVAIKDGKIDGNNLSFSVVFDFGGQEMKIDYKGVVSPDQLKLTFDMMGQPAELVLKKAK